MSLSDTNRSEDALMGVYGSLQRAMGMYTASDNTVGTLAPRKGRKETMYAILGLLITLVAIEIWYESNR